MLRSFVASNDVKEDVNAFSMHNMFIRWCKLHKVSMMNSGGIPREWTFQRMHLLHDLKIRKTLCWTFNRCKHWLNWIMTKTIFSSDKLFIFTQNAPFQVWLAFTAGHYIWIVASKEKFLKVFRNECKHQLTISVISVSWSHLIISKLSQIYLNDYTGCEQLNRFKNIAIFRFKYFWTI